MSKKKTEEDKLHNRNVAIASGSLAFTAAQGAALAPTAARMMRGTINVYHGAGKKAQKSIIKNGLIANKGTGGVERDTQSLIKKIKSKKSLTPKDRAKLKKAVDRVKFAKGKVFVAHSPIGKAYSQFGFAKGRKPATATLKYTDFKRDFEKNRSHPLIDFYTSASSKSLTPDKFGKKGRKAAKLTNSEWKRYVKKHPKRFAAGIAIPTAIAGVGALQAKSLTKKIRAKKEHDKKKGQQ